MSSSTPSETSNPSNCSKTKSGRNILGQIYQSYADVAVRYGLPIQLLAATDYQTWARDEIACAREFNLTILGGCCGTDRRYIEALAKEAQLSSEANFSEKCHKFRLA